MIDVMSLRIATGKQDTACRTAKISWLVVTNTMQTWMAIAYLALKPATRKYEASRETLKPRIARQY